jgi:hypothetical protein
LSSTIIFTVSTAFKLLNVRNKYGTIHFDSEYHVVQASDKINATQRGAMKAALQSVRPSFIHDTQQSTVACWRAPIFYQAASPLKFTMLLKQYSVLLLSMKTLCTLQWLFRVSLCII